MKKMILLLLLSLYAVFGLTFIQPISSEASSIQHSVYLVIGPQATIQSQTGQTIPLFHLNHAIHFRAAVGAPLPQPDDRVGFSFRGYANGENNTLTFYTTVPNVNNMILYAMWTPLINPRSNEPIPNTDRSLFLADLYLSKQEGVFETKYQFTFKAAEGDPTAVNFTEYYLQASFLAGETFLLRSKNPLISGVNSTVYPSLASGKAGLGYSLPIGSGKVSPNRTIDLVEVLGGPTVYNLVDFVFANGVQAGALRFKRDCTVNIYVVFYDNGGWVKFYVELV
ncbi:MAG: hypothetical protein U1C51_04125 [Candidatus Izemoplasmatales bacterium]|nr:hypothetical protein [Candidatus Izemoplasmatales bacterium]